MGEGAREASLAPFTGRGCRQAGEGQRNGCKPKHLCDRSTSVEEKVLRIQVLAQPLGLRAAPHPPFGPLLLVNGGKGRSQPTNARSTTKPPGWLFEPSVKPRPST